MNSKTVPDKQSKTPYNLILHIHPRKVRLQSLHFNLTFGLGGMAVLLIVVLVFTGLLLKFHYEPSPENAYNSILNLQNSLLFGKLLRNIHYWSSILLLLITFFHMLRVIFTGAYQKPRHLTWIFGMFLLLLVVLSNFTGYLLPWDQLSYWAVTIGTNLLQYIPLVGNSIREMLLGGNDVGSATLSNFFNLHTGIIPLLILVLLGDHFWRIRKAGGVILPDSEKDSPMVNTYPHLVAREFVVALALLALLLLVSVFFDAPLRERANPSFSPNPAKAPWYFMGLQELLIHFHPFFAIVVIPITVLAAGCWLPYIKMDDSTNHGIWFLSEKGKRSSQYALVTSFLFAVLFVLFSELLPDPENILPAIPSLILTGFIPFLLVTGTMYLFLKYLKQKFALNRMETIQSILVILITSYTVLSIIGILFRGQGMKLMWPWLIS